MYKIIIWKWGNKMKKSILLSVIYDIKCCFSQEDNIFKIILIRTNKL